MVVGLHRYHRTGQSHFITFSCYRRQPLLRSDLVRSYFLETLEQVRSSHRFEVFGYVLMPEHVHLLISEPEREVLSASMQVLKQTVSRRCSSLVGTKAGCFWSKRYYDFNVHTNEKRIEKLQYLHRNPVKRELVAKPEDWTWSSFRHYRFGEIGIVKASSEWTEWWRPKK
jgi:putative transposase